MSSPHVVSTSRVIGAAPSVIFDLLADPRKHSSFDASGSVVRVRKAPERLYLGARFSMDMKLGLSYFVSNKVVAFEENKCLAWHHFAQFVWRYDLEEVPGGTKVTESFNYDKPWSLSITLWHKEQSNLRDMTATLERIESIVTA
ncbi:MAG TPA: SRPBCC family protein [Acidimicrobiales bacterium]